jgi:diguanylate cyclase (GGDEF)-like protein
LVVARIRPLTWRAVLWATGALVVAFALCLQFKVGGAGGAAALDDVGEGVAALVASAACLYAAGATRGRARAAWAWIAASALAWTVGESLWCWYTYADGIASPFPSLADAGFVLAVPTIVVGVALLGFDKGQWWTGVRDALDGLIIAGSLMFISWMTTLGAALHSSGEGGLARALSLTYPISDVVVATIALAALARARGRRRRQLALLGTGLVALAVADGAFAYLSALNGGTGILDTGWVAGYLLVALAALAPMHAVDRERPAVASGSTTQMVLPYAVLGLAGVAAVAHIAAGGQFDVVLFALGAGTTVLVMVRQLLTMLENRRLTGRLEAIVFELRDRETQLAHQAFHDSLTGLANRMLFSDRLDHALARRARTDSVMAVMVCDLDDFKVVNDTLGHGPGDRLLQAMGERLRTNARAADTVARLGGDEFAVLLEGLHNPEEAYDVARRMTRALARPVTIGAEPSTETVSIGVAFARGAAGEHSQSLLRDADVAMYEAKAAGGNTFRVFEPRMLDDIVAQQDLKRDLRSAAGRPEEIELVYQPIIEVDTAAIAGMEALMRWRHPTRGLLMPAEFIEAAEDSGDIVAMGRSALRLACRQATAWLQQGLECPNVAVNLSPRQLEDPDVVWVVQSALEEHGLAPTALTLEITESMTLNGADTAIERLRRLHQLGVRIAIDDFGSGYSSLEYLRRLPVDVLKIDRGFTMHITQSAGAAVLLDAMVRLAHTLDLVTVVEGVETPEQLATVHNIGADLAQGFFIGEPASVADITAALRLRGIGAPLMP